MSKSKFIYEIVEIDNKFYPKIFISHPSMYHDDYWAFISKDLIEFNTTSNGYKYCKFKNWEDAYSTLDNFRKLKESKRVLVELSEWREAEDIKKKERITRWHIA